MLMPQFRVLPPEEIERLQNRRGRAVDLTPYIEHLRQLAPGQIAEAVLGPEEKKSTTKRRLSTAAKRLGMSLKYRRSSDGQLVYEVTAATAAE